jgi:hypothetical protein
MTNETKHTSGVIDRLVTDIHAAERAQRALKAMRECASAVTNGDPRMDMQHKLADDAGALVTLIEALFLQVRGRVYDRAEQAGRLLMREEIAPIARASGEQPVVFITGNSFMPPVRDLEQAERVWQAAGDSMTDPDLGAMVWEIFMQALDHEAGELNVLMDAPEYDNALYVVDTSRFEHVEDAEGDELGDEWRPVPPSN